ncbi:RNA polymerase sigma-70 factor [Olivibacter sitiensis]|uniref:RNA polymerase sigma-70 factor n=1 Tax=Olivibacter sitiensis TaxID=376470 RepID=UPI00040D0A32|nr:RNA polymerase sigma-70 factor [Olivibacter sitiensis]
MAAIRAIDPLLIRRLCAGDERAFREIYLLLHEKIYRFAFTFVKDEELSKEITQEVFLQLWLSRDKLSEDLPLYPYLFTHARRLTIDMFRKDAVVRKFRHDLVARIDHLSNDTENTVFCNELNRITEDAVSSLPKQQQVVFRMSRMQGLSYEEIAKELHISKNTVKYHLMCALKTLKSHFVKHDIMYLLLLLALLS